MYASRCLLIQVIRIQPNEAIYLKVNNKVPGLGLRIDTTRLDLSYKSKYNTQLPGKLCLKCYMELIVISGWAKAFYSYCCNLELSLLYRV